jgi:hypothetical protein
MRLKHSDTEKKDVRLRLLIFFLGGGGAQAEYLDPIKTKLQRDYKQLRDGSFAEYCQDNKTVEVRWEGYVACVIRW